jgi:DNA polymerase-3 subunit epsilon
MAYAVIDLETTGFSPARGDRIIELAVVLVDDDGRPEHEWTTLLNPQRDAGRAQLRGIRSEDLAGAPLIGEIASHLVGLLSGRTLVAHNQEFDLRFLKSELASDGFVLPATFDALDTMLWAHRAFGVSRLGDVCAVLDIDYDPARPALGDARAKAAILAALIAREGGSDDWRTDAANATFPLSADGSTTATGTARASATADGFVDTAERPLWERVSIPQGTLDAASAVYLDMLIRVLEDGLISTGEYSRLDAIAELTQLSPQRLVTLHASYLAAAYVEVLADGIVTADERRELVQIATILDLPVPEIPDVDEPAGDERAFTLAPGARVVFDGALSRPAEDWARLVTDAGLVTGSVTKSCAVLVAADAASQTGKARTARAHGIPIVTETEFEPVFEAYLAQRV